MGDYVGLLVVQCFLVVYDGNLGVGSDGLLIGSSCMDSVEFVDDFFYVVYEFGVLDGQVQVFVVVDLVQGRVYDGVMCSQL